MSDAIYPERWIPVPGYEDLYEVSDGGRIRSLPRRGTRGGVLAGAQNAKGYRVVLLYRDGVRRTVNVHVLVAAVFLGPRPAGQQVRHLDGDPGRCQVGNLAYGTQAENQQDSLRHGTHAQAAKDRCRDGHSYLDPANVVHRADGSRRCRACRNRQNRAYQRALRAAQS